MTRMDKKKWLNAMHEEINSLHENYTYQLVVLPKGRNALKNKWVYNIKHENSPQSRYKIRLVVKGFGPNKGIDFDKIFSYVVKMSSIKIILGFNY